MPLLREMPLPFCAHNECAYARTKSGAKGAGQGFSVTLSAVYLPCSASEQKLSVERKQVKGLVKGFPRGAPPPLRGRQGGVPLQASLLANELRPLIIQALELT